MVCLYVCVCALLCVFMWFEGERYLFVCSSDRCPFWPEHFSQLLQRIIACPKTVSFPRKSNKSQVLIIARIREQKRKEKGKRKKGDKASQGRRAAPNILLVYEHKSLIQTVPPRPPITYQITHLTVSAACCADTLYIFLVSRRTHIGLKFNWLIVRVFAELIYLTIDCAMRNN